MHRLQEQHAKFVFSVCRWARCDQDPGRFPRFGKLGRDVGQCAPEAAMASGSCLHTLNFRLVLLLLLHQEIPGWQSWHRFLS